MQQKHHALIIGGTGMLSDATLSLSEMSAAVTVFARTQRSLAKLGHSLSAYPAQYNPVKVDYLDSVALESSVLSSVEKHGPIDLVVAWIHSIAPEAPLLIAKLVAQSSPGLDYYHIFGSSEAESGNSAAQARAMFEELPGLSYHRIILGFIIEGNRSRWLRDEEISQGVVTAIGNRSSEYVVGVVKPWSMHP